MIAIYCLLTVHYTIPDGAADGGLELRIMLLSPAVLGLGLSLAKVSELRYLDGPS